MAPTSSLPVLPEEMLVEVVARVAASSSSPMVDLRHLRGACALVRDRVCGAALVRRSLNLSRVLQQTHDAETRERLIANTYAAGNLEAHFIQGMRVFSDSTPGLLTRSWTSYIRLPAGGTSRRRTCSL